MRKKTRKAEQKTIAHWYLQYSKRIAVFGIVQWAVVAIIALALGWFCGATDHELEDTIVAMVNNVSTSSSALAIATASGYYAHSAYDKKLKKQVEKALGPDENEDDNEEEVEG